MSHRLIVCMVLAGLSGGAVSGQAPADDVDPTKMYWMDLYELRNKQAAEVYRQSPFASLSMNYFARFSRDPQAESTASEVEVDQAWTVCHAVDASPLTKRMAGHLVTFLKERMECRVELQAVEAIEDAGNHTRAIRLIESGGGRAHVAESFTIGVYPDGIVVHGSDPAGVRDGVVRLVDRMGMRQAPFLETGVTIYEPRLKVRQGSVPWLGSYRDLVFLGFNAVLLGWQDLYEVSTSDAIDELVSRQKPEAINQYVQSAIEARQYGLKTYLRVNTKSKFQKDHPVFVAHPELRGALTWKEDGEYILCTEHPLVRRFLCESVAGVFQAIPELDGLVIIVGGEGFYHCFMRPFGVEKGHTNCARCEKLGPDVVVSNLCNALAQAAREVRPEVEVIAWPYSAGHVWSQEPAQLGMIERMQSGTALFTEIEKDETVNKPEGVEKVLWDYSIDLIGPGERAKTQVAACRRAGIPIYMKSEPELSFEAPRLSHVPCLDRWIARADALASCGADGAWVFPAFRQVYGASSTEVHKHMWWTPVPDREQVLRRLAARIAGAEAGPLLRNAWRWVSEAVTWAPLIPSYYTGPAYLGPAHPMCADPTAEVPSIFYGIYLFWIEVDDKEGMKKRPTFLTSPIMGGNATHARYYREMRRLLAEAIECIEQASPMVPQRCRVMFDAEVSAIRWFYHTARTESNFCESYRFRERLLSLAAKEGITPEEQNEARALYGQWRDVLLDEKANAEAALPVMEADPRLNFKFGGDHTFEDGGDMLRAKLSLIEQEIGVFLPSVAEKLGIDQ